MRRAGHDPGNVARPQPKRAAAGGRADPALHEEQVDRGELPARAVDEEVRDERQDRTSADRSESLFFFFLFFNRSSTQLSGTSVTLRPFRRLALRHESSLSTFGSAFSGLWS